MRYTLICLACLLALAACTGKGDDNANATADTVEVGPYTVSQIRQNIYHIQDYNRANPAGEEFDSLGNKTHFNNCSDIYLLVGDNQSLLIDLSNKIDWADSADVALRRVVADRIDGKPLLVTFTHNHGDHTGMLPAFLDDPNVHFWLPRTDFLPMQGKFPEQRTTLYDQGHTFDLGGLTVRTKQVAGHTDGSMVFFVDGLNLMFSGDAVGSGHGIWIFNEEGLEAYAQAVPDLMKYIEDPSHGINADSLQIYGGHYWQRDWLNLADGQQMGISYLRDMTELVKQMKQGTAESEPSNLNHALLDTYFRLGDAIIVCNGCMARCFAEKHSN